MTEFFARIEKEMAEFGITVRLNADAIAARKTEIEQLTATLQKTPDGAGPRPPSPAALWRSAARSRGGFR